MRLVILHGKYQTSDILLNRLTGLASKHALLGIKYVYTLVCGECPFLNTSPTSFLYTPLEYLLFIPIQTSGPHLITPKIRGKAKQKALLEHRSWIKADGSITEDVFHKIHEHAEHPNTMLLGFSQGAFVAGEYLKAHPHSQIQGAIFSSGYEVDHNFSPQWKHPKPSYTCTGNKTRS